MRNLIALIVFIIVSLVLPGIAAGQETEYVVRSYDLTQCIRPAKDDLAGRVFTLMPMGMISDRPVQYRDVEADIDSVDLSQITDLLYRLIGEDHFDRNGARMTESGHRLIIRSTEDVHRRVEKILAFLGRRLDRSVSLTFDVIPVETLNIPDAEFLQAALADGTVKPRFSRTGKVRLGDLFEILHGSTQRIVMDHEPEIAEASTVCEPIMKSIFVGWKVGARPMLAADGERILLPLYASFSQLTGPVSFRETGVRARVVRENIMEEYPVSQVLDKPEVEFGSTATTLLLEQDKPALICMAFPHLYGSGSLVMLVTAQLEPQAEHLDLDDGGRLASFDIGYIEIRHMGPDESWHEEEDDIWQSYNPPVYQAVMDLNRKMRHYPGVLEILWDEDFYPDLVLQEHTGDLEPQVMDHYLWLKTKPDLADAWERTIREVAPRDAESVNVEIRFVEVDGPPLIKDARALIMQNRILGRVSMPLRPGATSVSMAGMEGLMIWNYDVDVATKSAVPNMNVRSYLDGAVVRLQHEPARDTVKARIALQRLEEPMSWFNLGEHGDLPGIVDKPKFAESDINNRFPADGAPHLLGYLAMEGAEGVKTLYAVGQVKK